ncbi:hypothetical protein CEUSTIGMA_g1592.t1 [Chlamydomonas eustigma]|uniref:Uncharacterized protein n=1 Tax=Chlamydomonas eustigma TaxID=1157962 RepID=A0A250WTK1_9CHLO|nr:hypothetical protein CEUSTIGMA_g1592.t1 [Chlamydomonas eustigma]|eukprot:GAX74143.1 hypothetical protein CEUSTIGMA_g1592.t1 [Chlamydomonas eustigma]
MPEISNTQTLKSLLLGLSSFLSSLEAAFTSRSSDSSAVSCLQAIALAVGGGRAALPAGDVLAAAVVSGGHQAAILQLENQVLADMPIGMKTQANSGASPIPDLALCSTVVSAPAVTWGALADLYSRVGEPDLLRVVRLSHIVQCKGTIEALDRGAHGRQCLELNIIQKLESAFRCLATELTALGAENTGIGQPSQQVPLRPLASDIASHIQTTLGAESVSILGERVLEAATKLASEASQDLMADDSNPVIEQERIVWTEESFKCMEALGQWSELLGQVTHLMVDAEDMATSNEREALVAQRLLEGGDGTAQMVRPYCRASLYQGMGGSTVHLTGHSSGHASALGAILAEAEFLPQWGLSGLQALAPVEVATYQLLSKVNESAECLDTTSAASSAAASAALSHGAGVWALCRLHLESVLERLRSQWSGLHVLSSRARFSCLATLQPLSELQETIALLSGIENLLSQSTRNRADVNEQIQTLVQRLLSTWQSRWPTLLTDAVSAAGLQYSVLQQGSTGCTADGLLSLLHTRQLLLGLVSRSASRSWGAASNRILSMISRGEERLIVMAASCSVKLGHLDTAEHLLLPMLERSQQAAAVLRGSATTAGTAAAADGAEAVCTALNRQHVLLTASELHLAQVRTTPDAATANRPVFRRAIGDLLRMQLPVVSAPKAAASLDRTGLAAWDDRYSHNAVLRADVERLLVGGTALAELVPWAANSDNASKQISAALTTLKDAADRALKVYTDDKKYRLSEPSTLIKEAGPPWSVPTDASGPGSRVMAPLVSAASMQLAAWCLRLLPQQAPAPGRGEEVAARMPPLTQDTLSVLNQQGGLSGIAMKHLLLAMSCHGGQAACMQFPMLLDLLGVDPKGACPEFERGWCTLPASSLLPWVHQMLSRLGSDEEGTALMGPLINLAVSQPQRLYCAVRMAYSTWKQGSSNRDEHDGIVSSASLRYQKLIEVTAGEGLLKEFVDALDALTYPHQRWDWYKQAMMRAMEAGRPDTASKLWAEEAWTNLFGRFLETQYTGSSPDAEAEASSLTETPKVRMLRSGKAGQSAAAVSKLGSTVNVQFAIKFSGIFKAAFGGSECTDAKQPAYSSFDAFMKKCRDIDVEVGKYSAGSREQHGRRESSSFTQWFSTFAESTQSSTVLAMTPSSISTGPTQHLSRMRSGGARRRLLLPVTGSILEGGQDDLNEVEVVGFGRQLEVFRSKQLPKRLTLYCSDFTSRDFVVKGAEDLRIDARIQQLFDIMNGMVSQRPACSIRRLQLPTFPVVPVTPSCGLLGFVPNTRPLQAVLSGVISPQELKRAEDAYHVHVNGKGSVGQAANPVKYLSNFQDMTTATCADSFHRIQAGIRWDGLRAALLSAAPGPEAFIANRSHFTGCLATCNVFGWVAGVGDRHTQNLLVEEAKGGLTPIDFGYSFGTATTLLSIPELMPFRLTRQLQGAMMPHDGMELLVAPMTEALRSLRGNKQLLGSILAIFMREPLAEWQREARLLNAAKQHHAAALMKGGKQAQVRAGRAASEVLSVEAVEQQHILSKVDLAMQKLSLSHPASITLDELASRHQGKPYWSGMQQIVQGEGRDPTSCKFDRCSVFLQGGRCVDEEQQVRCLLDQATDPGILGRTWEGWRPYL